MKASIGGNDHIIVDLHYVESQLPGACKKPEWGKKHGIALRRAAIYIRQLEDACVRAGIAQEILDTHHRPETP